VPKVHPSMAQVVVGGGLFAVVGRGLFVVGGGGGSFRAGTFPCAESKVAACRSLQMLELSPKLCGKEPVGRRTNNRLPSVATPSPVAWRCVAAAHRPSSVSLSAGIFVIQSR
jgi:hypothetical protein